MQTFRPNLKWYETESEVHLSVEHRDITGEKILFESKRVVIEFPEGEKQFKQELELKGEIDPE